MDITRIQHEVRGAYQHFAMVELHPTTAGGVFVKAALSTSAGSTYVLAITFENYPNVMPEDTVTSPAMVSGPHRYT